MKARIEKIVESKVSLFRGGLRIAASNLINFIKEIKLHELKSLCNTSSQTDGTGQFFQVYEVNIENF